MTLQLHWLEYRESVAARGFGLKPYQYSQFCELYGAWRVRLKPSMRRVHRAGDKVFVDYSGRRPRVVNPDTGEVLAVELFVMVLPFTIHQAQAAEAITVTRPTTMMAVPNARAVAVGWGRAASLPLSLANPSCR